MVIIENYNQFEGFLEDYHSSDWSFLHFIGSKNKHPLNDYPLMLYIRTSTDNEYIISFGHDEAGTFTLDVLLKLHNDKPKYVADVKSICHFTDFDNIIDLQQTEFERHGNLVDSQIFLTPSHRYFHNVFSKIERVGIKVDKLEVPIKQRDNVSKEHLMYTNYNVLTSTGRPSNAYDGMNFAAINKSDGSRKMIISRWDELIEFDYDAYHVRLIAKLIGYDFDNQSVHEHFSKLYNVSYEDSKKMTFRYLYGGVPDDVAEKHEFFSKVKKYYNKLWNRFKIDKVLQTNIYRRRINMDIKDLYPSKLFNYMIQSLETERNILILKRVLEETKNFESRLILYHYDSFLFDYNKNDGDTFFEIVQKELQHGGFPVKMKRGNNYDELN